MTASARRRTVAGTCAAIALVASGGLSAGGAVLVEDVAAAVRWRDHPYRPGLAGDRIRSGDIGCRGREPHAARTSRSTPATPPIGWPRSNWSGRASARRSSPRSSTRATASRSPTGSPALRHLDHHAGSRGRAVELGPQAEVRASRRGPATSRPARSRDGRCRRRHHRSAGSAERSARSAARLSTWRWRPA